MFAVIHPVICLFWAVSCTQSSIDVHTAYQPTTTLNGVTTNGVGSNGIHLNGLKLNGIKFNGIKFNGLHLNSLQANGLKLNGLDLNGLHLNGIKFNGIKFNGIKFNGLHLNGLKLNGIKFNGIKFNGAPLTSTDEQTFDDIVKILTECALPSHDSITVEDLNLSAKTYHGLLGHDPGWKDGEPDLAKYDVMADCVQTRGVDAGYVVVDDSTNLATFKDVLRYAVECALPQGASITFDGDSYFGSLGLAPHWETGPLLLPDDGILTEEQRREGQMRVSACLAARTNSLGQTVQISMRGFDMPVSALEQRLFSQHEGAFVADLFNDTPYIESCDVAGGISGRSCASDPDTCGFVPIGDCQNTSVCIEDPQTPGVYLSCGGRSNVLSTYLSLDHAVAFGKEHTCSKRPDGSVICWGNNANGQLGQGSTPTQSLTPLDVSGLTGKTASLASSYLHTCARSMDGELHCWGDNYSGQLGDGTTIDQASPIRVDEPGANVAQVSTSDLNTCAVTTSGTLWCWGDNSHGQLGNGGTTSHSTPQIVSAFPHAVKVAAARHTCAINAGGNLSCWGYNANGQVGNNATQNQHTPVVIATDAAVDVCTGYQHSCAAFSDGSMKCWGSNANGRLGDGTTSTRYTPTPVIGLPANVAGIGCGNKHTCARLTDGTLWCWGKNYYGQVGKGASSGQEIEPVQVANIVGVVDVVVGRDFTCAELRDGTVHCWGDNNYGQLGDGTTSDQAAPVAMTSTFHPCGDGTCNAGETRSTCPIDCATCGDDICDPTEDCGSCPSDCGTCACATCDVTNRVACGVSLQTVTDCGLCGQSGGSCLTCQVSLPNTCTTTDCTLCAGASCGDGTCDPGESCSSCSADCGACPPICGDGTCDPGESCSSCSADCGACPPICGDGTCDPGEDCSSSNPCESDCGSCGPTCLPKGSICIVNADCCSNRCTLRNNGKWKCKGN